MVPTPTPMTVPMTIEYEPSWLTWVGSTTMCLKALGVDCDATDVAAYSGYAFVLTINGGLCPSGPTCLNWHALNRGANALGRSVLEFSSGDCYTEGSRNDRTRAHCRALFEMVRAEIQAGRPCVIWGAGPPEFGVVRGIEGEDYLMVAGGPTPERLAWDAIDAPGGPYGLAFPTPVAIHDDRDFTTLRQSLARLTRLNSGPGSRCGLDAYSFWIAQLQVGDLELFGNSYNTQCWAEARRHAHRYFERLVDRHGAARPLLVQTRDALAEVALHMGRLAELFPFTQEEGCIEDSVLIEEAVGLLKASRGAEERAIGALRSIPFF